MTKQRLAHTDFFFRLRLEHGILVDILRHEHGHSLGADLRLYPVFGVDPPSHIEAGLL